MSAGPDVAAIVRELGAVEVVAWAKVPEGYGFWIVDGAQALGPGHAGGTTVCAGPLERVADPADNAWLGFPGAKLALHPDDVRRLTAPRRLA